MRPADLPARLFLALCLALASMVFPGPLSAAPFPAPQASGDSTKSAASGPAIDPAQASKSQADSLAKPPKSRSDSVIVVKHHFNHREQIITGSVIMTCLALMMVAMNNYNPR